METGQQPARPTTLLSDGSLEFRVRRKNGEEQTISIDLLVLKLICEECEDQHQLRASNGTTKPTAAFLQDLAKRLCGAGVDNCSPSLAWQLWFAGIEQMNDLKKSMSETPNSPSGSESTPAHSPPPSGLDGSLTLSE